jgi:hypothetical protein
MQFYFDFFFLLKAPIDPMIPATIITAIIFFLPGPPQCIGGRFDILNMFGTDGLNANLNHFLKCEPDE